MSQKEEKNNALPEKDEKCESSGAMFSKLKWNTERYEQVEQIGVGAYGVVFKAKDLQRSKDDTNQEDRYVAMKCLRVENTEQGMPLSMVREIALLRQMETKEHPNVVKLLDICLGLKTCHETQLMLVFEHIDQDLDMYLRACGVDLEEDTIRSVMHQLLLGTDFLHSMRVVHRDLKPQNILISTSGKIKIADFGLARIFSVDMALTAVVVTLWYRAPEVLLQDSYDTAVDLWSIGCIFAELYNKRPLFRGSGDVNQLRRIFELLGRPSPSEWPPDVAIPITAFSPQSPKSAREFVPRMTPSAADLFLKLLTFDPSARPNPGKALSHKFFQEGHLSSDVNLRTSESFDKVSDPKNSTTHRRRMPYTMNMGMDRPLNDENEPLPCSLDLPSSRNANSASGSNNVSAFESTKTEDGTNNSATYSTVVRKRAFGNPLPLNVKDGASAEPLPIDPYQESAFLTPPSDLASSSSNDELSSRSSSESNISQACLQSFLDQQSSGLVLEASVVRPDSSTPSREGELYDPAHVMRRSRPDSESHSRMSWTCEPFSGKQDDFCSARNTDSSAQMSCGRSDPSISHPSIPSSSSLTSVDDDADK